MCVMCVAVESMFSAMCECQALHPDPEDSDSEDEFEGEEYDVEEAGECSFECYYVHIQYCEKIWGHTTFLTSTGGLSQ